MQKYLWIYLAVVNTIAFIMCVYDKRAAVRKKFRISEKALFIISIAGGAAGMLAGMLLVRHKTNHKTFMVIVPLLIAVHAVLLILYVM